MRKNKSKKFAMILVGITAILTFYALHQKLESASGLIFGAGVPSAIALYMNKQHQDRKWGELEQLKQQENG